MSVDRPLSRPLVVVKNAAQPLLYPLARPLVRSALYSTSALTRFAVNGVEAALALDFIGGEYRTANTSTTFADAFTGTSPKLTYSTAAGSNSTMVNSEGKIVWAPHNLLDYSEDFSQWTASNTDVDPNVTDVLAPDGTQTVDKVKNTGDTGGKLLYKNGVASGQTTVAVFARAAEFSRLRINEISGNRFSANFNLPDEEATLTNGADGIDARITFIGDGWYLCEIDHSASTATNSIVGYPASAETTSGNPNYDADDTSGIYIWGAHVYRSDLGGMHPVPGAVGDFQYYVPTNGNPEYLPRVGHHVYNGSTWVNEGLLIESEPRTNLEPDSEDFSTFPNNNVGTRNVDATGPDGQTSATTIVANSIGGEGNVAIWSGEHTVSTSTAYTFSVFLKAGTKNWARLYTINFTSPSNVGTSFDLANGVVGSVATGHTATMQDFGKGWYRCAITFTTDTVDTTGQCRIYLMDSDTDAAVPLDGVSSIQVYGLQLDQGEAIPNTNPVQYKDAPTPSSYMPTFGGTYTRTAQSLTVPANWYDADNPTYTGPELVTNGGFDGSTSGWAGNNATLSLSSDRLRVTDNGASSFAYQVLTVEPGKTYKLTFDYLFPSANTSTDYEVNIRNTNQSGSILKGLNTGTTTWVEDVLSSNSLVFTPNTSTVGLTLASSSTTGDYADFDNISVRQVSAPQFGWPEPEYIGSELVTDFSTYADQTAFDVDWTRSANSTFSNGTLVLQNAGYGETNSSNIGYTAGTPVVVTFDVTVSSGTVEVWLGDTLSFDYQLITTTSSGTFTFTGATSGTDGHIYIRSLAAGTTASVSNISVREINPLSVSIQMDGRMTYADDGASQSAVFYNWAGAGANIIRADLATNGAYTGGVVFMQYTPSFNNSPEAVPGSYSPGVNVPYNISSRHGSTFIRGAADGVLANLGATTPTALPDLSSANLQIAQDFMGTIGTFRQFAGDIGDTGLVTATNPSTEPTLSLTFDGTNGSFYNLSWSE